MLPKLTWSAPQDARWISSTGTLRCSCAGEIFLLLKSSECVVHDLTLAYSNCSDKPKEPTQHIVREWWLVRKAVVARTVYLPADAATLAELGPASRVPLLCC